MKERKVVEWIPKQPEWISRGFRVLRGEIVGVREEVGSRRVSQSRVFW